MKINKANKNKFYLILILILLFKYYNINIIINPTNIPELSHIKRQKIKLLISDKQCLPVLFFHLKDDDNILSNN